MLMLTKGSALCLVIQFSGIKSFRRVNGQVYPFDDHGYGLGGFVERSVLGSALSWELLDILHHLVLPTTDMCPSLTNKLTVCTAVFLQKVLQELPPSLLCKTQQFVTIIYERPAQ